MTSRGPRLVDPLLPHLLDIVQDPTAENLILAGGLGLNLKRQHLIARQAETLVPISELPEARATQDMDFFLTMTVFTERERANDVAALLKRLGYEVYSERFQFGKSLSDADSEYRVKVDLLSRIPVQDENVNFDAVRVGNKRGNPVHGRTTSEAFALDLLPIQVEIDGNDSSGNAVHTKLLVPHPFTWLNMKIRASYDWYLEREGRIPPRKQPRSAKHAYDVMLITAMLTFAEQTQAANFARQFAEHDEAQLVRTEAAELFGSATSIGWLEVRRQTGQELIHSQFWEAIAQCLGIL